jgi:hypothetical protein
VVGVGGWVVGVGGCGLSVGGRGVGSKEVVSTVTGQIATEGKQTGAQRVL